MWITANRNLLIGASSLFLLFLSASPLHSEVVKSVATHPLNTQNTIPEKFASPSEAVRTFLNAFKDKDFDQAWESLSSTSKNAFVRSMSKPTQASFNATLDAFNKSEDWVRKQFWIPWQERSRLVPLIQNAIYNTTDNQNNVAMVEMKSGGITEHFRAVNEGAGWRMAFVESKIKDKNPIRKPVAKTQQIIITESQPKVEER